MKYIEVAVMQKTGGMDTLFNYTCEDDSVKVGDKVLVPFGQGNRPRAAFVFSVCDEADDTPFKLKGISGIDKEQSLPPELIRLCSWLKRRCICGYSDVLSCLTPPAMKKKREMAKTKVTGVKAPQTSVLTRDQREAMGLIEPYINEKKSHSFLLFGVTGSGKTEVYLQTIQKATEQGRTSIVLVPEISLTIQTISRFKDRFGAENVAILHSRLSAGERFDEWMRIRSGQVKIVVGVRSAIFAPLSNIGAIIIDEEHEGTYKSEQSPKYDAIEVAGFRAEENGAVLILGSATPSVISYRLALSGGHTRLVLRERYNKNPLPVMEAIDMRNELKNGNKSMISVALYREIKRCIQQEQGVILFLNKRGYSSFVSCRSCGFVMKCEDCGISLTYHKAKNKVICHMCGHSRNVPHVCPVCESKYIKHFGTGTERLEEAARGLFPEASIARLDFDTTRRKGSLESILADFQKKKTQILIGTQIVAKGLDFKHVGVVGVVAADLSLYIPDYRSAERTFQLITQAAGRAGRGEEQGKVIIQSYAPENPAIRCALAQDYEGLFREEIKNRKNAGYPPFKDIILITVSSPEEAKAKEGIFTALSMLKERLGSVIQDEVLGPKQAHLYKIKDRFRYQMVIKSEPEKRELYMDELCEIRKVFYGPDYKDYQFLVDVNPYSAI